MQDKDLKNVIQHEQDHALHTKIIGRFRGYFLAGILVTAPIAITFYLTYVFVTFVDRKVSAILPHHWYEGFYGGTAIPGIGLVVAILFFVVVGWFATNFFGRIFIRIYEYILERVPLIRTLYGALKQIFETIMASKSQAFRDCVLVEYPRKGIWSIGFLTGITEGEVQRLTDDEVLNVFIPTTPNPTSGYLLFVPRRDLYFLGMTVEEGIKMVVSAGIITPPDAKHKKLETASQKKSKRTPKPRRKK